MYGSSELFVRVRSNFTNSLATGRSLPVGWNFAGAPTFSEMPSAQLYVEPNLRSPAGSAGVDVGELPVVGRLAVGGGVLVVGVVTAAVVEVVPGSVGWSLVSVGFRAVEVSVLEVSVSEVWGVSEVASAERAELLAIGVPAC